MTGYNFFSFLFVIFVGILVMHGLALTTEAIANGAIANQSHFPYQAAIFGRPDPHEVNNLICSGIIVAASWILSVAGCFMLNSALLKPLIFTAVVGFDDVQRSSGFIQRIAYIYTEYYSYLDSANDIVMAKTANAFTLSDTVNVVNIPYPGEPLLGQFGLVSGYGCSKVETEVDEQGHLFYIETDSNLTLRYTYVKYNKSYDCAIDFPDTYTGDKFCGVAVEIEGEYTGMCSAANAFKVSFAIYPINTPESDESFLDDDGIVSGYGSSEIESQVDALCDMFYVETEPDFKLRYTYVKYSKSRECFLDFPYTYAEDNFSGMASDNQGEYTCMRSNDAGNPLVINDNVVGLSSRNYEDCDDTIYGSLYTQMAAHYTFIHNIIMGIPKRTYKQHNFIL